MQAMLLLWMLGIGCALAEEGASQSRGIAAAGRILRSHTLELEMEYLRLYKEMSMKQPPPGKGKKCKPLPPIPKGMPDDMGKGGKGRSPKGKGKGRGKKDGKGKIDEEECPEGTMGPSYSPPVTIGPPGTIPTLAPAIVAPTTLSPGVPTQSPVVSTTIAPTIGNTTSTIAPSGVVPPNVTSPDVTLQPYFVFYTIEQTRIPTTDDVLGVANFTDAYLNTFLQEAFAATATIEFVSSLTESTGTQFRLGEPIRVDYSTTISFGPSTTTIPNANDLNAIIAGAFEGANGEAYITTLITQLSSTNIFATTSAVSYELAPVGTVRGGFGITVAFVSAAIVIIAAAVVLCRQKRYEPIQNDMMNKATYVTDSDDTDGSSDDTTTDYMSQSQAVYRFDGEKALNESNMEWIVYHDDHYPRSVSDEVREGLDDDIRSVEFDRVAKESAEAALPLQR